MRDNEAQRESWTWTPAAEGRHPFNRRALAALTLAVACLSIGIAVGRYSMRGPEQPASPEQPTAVSNAPPQPIQAAPQPEQPAAVATKAPEAAPAPPSLALRSDPEPAEGNDAPAKAPPVKLLNPGSGPQSSAGARESEQKPAARKRVSSKRRFVRSEEDRADRRPPQIESSRDYQALRDYMLSR
jgi:type IV secretory pathway VirB10-like protein